ncbi:MAG: hypothetical protein JRI25_22110, partial [Deltaproteobacteria bacterium]|nr:hypothetical protein [Deltaproteobacteria bacterium]
MAVRHGDLQYSSGVRARIERRWSMLPAIRGGREHMQVLVLMGWLMACTTGNDTADPVDTDVDTDADSDTDS